MFTGLVEETGVIRSVRRTGRSLQLTVGAARVLAGSRTGDSVAVNGVCLTMVALGPDWFTADVMPETYARTNLSEAAPGTLVNLERAMALGDRFGGHIVQGHVDATGVVRAVTPDEIAVRLTVAAPVEILRYLVPRGSVAVDGVSLTAVSVGATEFELSLIPHTYAVTALSRRRPGDRVNLEVDILAKYVERLLAGSRDRAPEPAQARLTEEFLRKQGFAD